MRYTHFLALAAVAGAPLAAASAQGSRVTIAPPAFGYSVERESNRAALGVGTQLTGTLRDTLGLVITSITKDSPAEKAGLEEGNRISAINGVSLRMHAADVEDGEMSGAVQRRLVRELERIKPGDEVELRVYRDGRSSTVKVKTASSDDLFSRTATTRSRADMDDRPVLGFNLGSTGSRRDTLGVLVMSVSDSTPAAKAGLEEGNRIAAINGVNLRVAREDAGDRSMSSIKAQRLQREISALTPGENVTLKVYSNGQFRDVTMKVAKASELPRSRSGYTYYNTGDGFFSGVMPALPPMPAMPSMPSIRSLPSAPSSPESPRARVYHDMSPEVRGRLEEARVRVQEARPQIREELERIRPQLERLRIEAPLIRRTVIV